MARLLSGFSAVTSRPHVETTWLNGAPALRIDPAGEFDSAVSLTVEGGRITRIYAIRNPRERAGVDSVTLLTRRPPQSWLELALPRHTRSTGADRGIRYRETATPVHKGQRVASPQRCRHERKAAVAVAATALPC